jgi:25S rRNA (uracil2634-N3)-methyltransferase
MASSSSVTPERNTANLHVLSETLKCAHAGCVPCIYKLVVHTRVGERPNQRAEDCLRESALRGSASGGRGAAGLYAAASSGDEAAPRRMLTVGDGDFSFSLALARAVLGGGDGGGGGRVPVQAELWVTSYEPKETMLRVYPGVEATMDELAQLGAVVLYEVDATNLEPTLRDALVVWGGTAAAAAAGWGGAGAGAGDGGGNVAAAAAAALLDGGSAFWRIIWNFPCMPVVNPNAARQAERADNAGLDGQGEDMSQNQAILQQFARSAVPLLAPGDGEVHIAHKTIAPFSWWDVPRQMSDTGRLQLKQRVVFDRSAYPPYRNRKALHKKSFPCHDAEIFVFGVTAEEKAGKGKGGGKAAVAVEAGEEEVAEAAEAEDVSSTTSPTAPVDVDPSTLRVVDLKKELTRLGDAPGSFQGMKKGDLVARLCELQQQHEAATAAAETVVLTESKEDAPTVSSSSSSSSADLPDHESSGISSGGAFAASAVVDGGNAKQGKKKLSKRQRRLLKQQQRHGAAGGAGGTDGVVGGTGQEKGAADAAVSTQDQRSRGSCIRPLSDPRQGVAVAGIAKAVAAAVASGASGTPTLYLGKGALSDMDWRQLVRGVCNAPDGGSEATEAGMASEVGAALLIPVTEGLIAASRLELKKSMLLWQLQKEDKRNGAKKESKKKKKRKTTDADDEDSGRLSSKQLAQALSKPRAPRTQADLRGGKRERREFSLGERRAGRKHKKTFLGAVHFT